MATKFITVCIGHIRELTYQSCGMAHNILHVALSAVPTLNNDNNVGMAVVSKTYPRKTPQRTFTRTKMYQDDIIVSMRFVCDKSSANKYNQLQLYKPRGAWNTYKVKPETDKKLLWELQIKQQTELDIWLT